MKHSFKVTTLCLALCIGNSLNAQYLSAPLPPNYSIVKIIEEIGQLYFEDIIVNNSYTKVINISNWHRGVYFVIMTGENAYSKVEKILKE